MIKVSIIVPVYNVEEYLDKCLSSLVNQNFDSFEIIVVNDESPDNSQQIIDEYVNKYSSKIKAYKKSNGGLSDARNYGLKYAKGEYIAFVDSDDYVEEDYLSSLYNEAVSTNSDIVICDLYKTFNDREEVMFGKSGIINDCKADAIISLPAAWNKLYKKSLFTNNDIYYPEKLYYEDLATTSRLIVMANNVSYVNKALYHYVQRENSIMNQVKYNKKNSDIFKSLDILKKFLINNGFYDKYIEEVEYLYITHLLHDYALRVYRYKEGRDDIKLAIKFIKNNYKKWYKNKYFNKLSLKYKIVCWLIYFDKISILKTILK